MDLKGQVISIASSRSWGFSELVGLLIESGHPIIIATDKNPTPGTVDRIKRAFNAILHTPISSLSVDQKLRDTKPYRYANEHERDALAAAIDALRSIKNKLESVEKKAPPEVTLDELQMLVLRGHTVDSAINLLKKPLAKVDNEVDSSEQGRIPSFERDLLGPDIYYLKALIKRQDEQISRLASYVVDLKQSLQLSQKKVLKLQNKIDMVQSENAKNVKLNKEISFRQKEIDRLAEELAHSKRVNTGLKKRSQKLKQIRAAEHKALKAVKIVKSFNREAIQAADEQIGLAESIILLEDASGGGIAAAELLVSKGIRAVVLKNEMSDAARKILFSANVPILSMREVPVQLSGNLITIDKKTLEIMIEKGHTEIANIKQQERLDSLEMLVEAYKHDRMKSGQNYD